MKVQEIMSTDLAYLSVNDNLFEAACLMRDHHIGLIPVVDEQRKLVGVVTDRDLVVRGIAERRPNSLEVGKVMSSMLVKASPDMAVEKAVQIMEDAQVRRLPVVDETDHLIGIVSLGDIAIKYPQARFVSQALSEISETHHSDASNDLSNPSAP